MTWYLAGLGHRTWNDVRQICAGMTCAWADYDGYHLVKGGGCPAAAPPYSHLWAWSPELLVRVRVDGDHGVVGILTTSAVEPPDSALFERVEVRERVATSFREPPTTISLMQVIGAMPVVFVAGDQASRAAPLPAPDMG
jgi:hypothetical protein